jgi:exodeoxyribonuclease VII small subunit
MSRRDEVPGPHGDPEGLEEALNRLEEITRSLEGGDLELHNSLSLYEEGVRLVRLAEESIRSAELRIERLNAEAAADSRREEPLP